MAARVGVGATRRGHFMAPSWHGFGQRKSSNSCSGRRLQPSRGCGVEGFRRVARRLLLVGPRAEATIMNAATAELAHCETADATTGADGQPGAQDPVLDALHQAEWHYRELRADWERDAQEARRARA